MHSCLRPELRAAQRVLRASGIPQSPRITPRLVVRSFAHFARLREQQPTSTPSKHNGNHHLAESAVHFPGQPAVKPTPENAEDPDAFVFPDVVRRNIDALHHSRLREWARNNPEVLNRESQAAEEAPPTLKHGTGPEDLLRNLTAFRKTLLAKDKLDNWQDRDRRKAADEEDIKLWLQTGEVPPAHRVIEHDRDLPSQFKDYIGRFPHSVRVPFLYSDDPFRAAHWFPIPTLDQIKIVDDNVTTPIDGYTYVSRAVLEATKQRPMGSESSIDRLLADAPTVLRTLKATATIVPNNEATEHSADQPPSEERSQSTNYHGSWQRRRKRALDNKLPSPPQKTLPSWFYDSNVLRSPISLPKTPTVMVVSQPPSGSDASISSVGGDNQVQISPKESPNEGPPNPPVTVYGKGRPGPTPDVDVPDGPDSPKVPTSTIVNTKALKDNRYFIDETQYEELSATFKGRLQAPHTPNSAYKGSFHESLAWNHLTILHGARDSELLLDALIRDLCNSVGADRVRLDAQDIAELLLQAETDKSNTPRALRQLSWKLYNSLYALDEYQESSSPRHEEENDDEDAEDDNEHEMPSIEIPIGSFVSNIGSKLPDMLNNMRKLHGRLDGGGGFGGSPMAAFILPTSDTANGFSAMDYHNALENNKSCAATINSIMSSTADAQKLDGISATPSAEQNDAKQPQESGEPVPPRPLIIHLENYKLLQDSPVIESFINQLISRADQRRQEGQTVMVVGTDSLRDFSKSSEPRSILENQANKSYGVSTAIVLTPVYPDRESELALNEDRKTRIRNINARHLHQVLKGRGVLFHGLEDGFWNRDYLAEIGQRDHDALSTHFWPFVQVQRIAAVIAGMQSEAPLAEACAIIAASDESKVAWAQRNQPDLYKQEKKEENKTYDRQLRAVRSKATRHEKKLMSGVIEAKKIQTTFDDIHIPVDTVEALKMLTTLSLQRPDAFRYGVLKSDRIPGLLLYGPPGTGKTLAAKAVAKESGATMLEVSAADLNDMYVGEGEKNVQALFSLAKKLSPCVVFLDEADAMFSARSTSRRASHRELLNQFLKEWDGMSNDSGSAFIMVATNRPMDLDDAVLRRLPRRLLVDLPTEADRLKILQIHLRNEMIDPTVNLADLAKRTPFYSGSDLKNVAVAAALNAVKDENEAAARSKLDKPEEQHEYPSTRLLIPAHFDKALDEITASISQDMSSLKEIKKFDEQYGDKKGRKRKSPKWGFKSAAEADKVLDTVKVRS